MSSTELVLPNGEVLPVRDHRSSRTLEVRDPRGATQTIGWRSPVLPQVEQWDAMQAFRFGYLANVIAYRCVQLRADAVAKIPLVAGRKLGDYTTIRDDAPIARLLGPPPGGPAPRLSARKLIRWTIAQELVTGRRAWEIETDDKRPDGRPIAFWPLASAHLRPVPSKSGSEWFRVFHYGNHHDPVKLPPELVFYGWDPSGTDFRQAESALQAARYDLSLVTLCDQYGLGFLRNNAVPAAIITTTKFPDEAARRKFMANWESDHLGPHNAGRVALNELGDDGDGAVADSIDVKVLGLSAKDARLVETRKEAMLEIAIALGTPWSKLDASGRTFDNADAEDATWHNETILPDLLDLQDDINMQLAPRLGDEVVWFDLRNVPAFQRRHIPMSQTVGAPSLVQARLWTIDEARADYGQDPLPDGTGNRLMTVEEIQALRGAAGGGDEVVRAALAAVETRLDELTPPEPLAIEQRQEPPAEQRVVDPEAVEMRRATIWRATDAVATSIEARWARTFRRLFARQLDATLARLTGKRGRQSLGYGADGTRADPVEDLTLLDIAALFSLEFWRTETVAVAEDLYAMAAGAGLDRVALTFGVSFDVEAPWVVEYITTRANQLAGQVSQTTYDAIVDQITDGVSAGESIDDLATRIRGVFSHADEVRSLMIARTEVISAYNGAAVAGAEALPRDIVVAQEWIATRDGRTRDTHAAADGQVQLIGLPFSIAGTAAAYPGDPALPAKETVNCRCAVAFLTPDEYVELGRAAPVAIEQRVAKAMMSLVPSGGEFDLLGWRRALEESAA
jgi:HK97 family phage portal protein